MIASSVEKPILTYRNASVTLSRRGADELALVRGVDLTVNPNEIVALVGESGSGKTMTALSALGLLPQGARFTADEAMLKDHDLRSLSSQGWRSLRGSQVGIVFQEPLSSLNPVLTIGDQIGEVLYYKRGLTRRQRCSESIDLLARMGLARPEQLLTEYPFQLSGGMRQRVMLAIAMAGQPALLIADEPTTALDNSVQAQVLELIVKTAEQTGVGVLLITHDLSVVAQVADRVTVMRHGSIVEAAEVGRLFRAPVDAYTRHLIALAPHVPAVVNNPALADMGAAEAKRPPSLLELRNVTKIYRQPRSFNIKQRETHALDNVSLVLGQGRALGLVGESGSGKSSLAKIITGLSKPDGGEVLFAGQDLFYTAQAGRFDIQMVFQDPFSSLNPRMRIADIIIEPLRTRERLPPDRLRHEAEKLLDAVGLPRRMADRFPHQLSGGQRQRVGIARALSAKPRLLILDEPVSALDVSVQAEILALLQRLREDFHLTMIFIAHGLDSVYAVCDDIAVLEKGRLVEYGPRDVVFGTPKHAYTRKLIDAILDSDPQRSRFKQRGVSTLEASKQ